MKKLNAVSVLLVFLFSAGGIASERFYINSFIPTAVILGDNHLQLNLPFEINSNVCSTKDRIVVHKDHPMFDHFVAMAMTSFVSGKKLKVAISSPCLGSPSWFQIANVMQLVD